MMDSNRFVSDKAYATGKTLYLAVIVMCLLAVFITTKVVTEVVAWSDGDDTYPSNIVSVTGEGEVMAITDVAEFSFSVNEKGNTVEAAQDIASGKINSAIDYLKKNGVEEKDIKTTGYNAYPQYKYTYCFETGCTTEQKLIGYEVSQTITVTVRDTAKAGDLLSGVAKSGLTNILGLAFKVDDLEKYKNEARLKAIEKAKFQAEVLAKALGVKLKGVVSFSEDSGDYGYGMGGDSMIAKSEGMMASEAPQLPAGEEKVKSRVYVTYEIR